MPTHKMHLLMIIFYSSSNTKLSSHIFQVPASSILATSIKNSWKSELKLGMMIMMAFCLAYSYLALLSSLIHLLNLLQKQLLSYPLFIRNALHLVKERTSISSSFFKYLRAPSLANNGRGLSSKKPDPDAVEAKKLLLLFSKNDGAEAFLSLCFRFWVTESRTFSTIFSKNFTHAIPFCIISVPKYGISTFKACFYSI